MTTLLKRSGITHHGRDGYVATKDGRIRLNLSTPEEMSGIKTANTNSFELVALAYSACLGGAVQRALEMKHVTYEDFSVTVENEVVKDEKNGGKLFLFNIKVQIDGVEDALKTEVVDVANALCPFSKAIQGNVETNVTIQ